jgi:hypothetical protein
LIGEVGRCYRATMAYDGRERTSSRLSADSYPTCIIVSEPQGVCMRHHDFGTYCRNFQRYFGGEQDCCASDMM